MSGVTLYGAEDVLRAASRIEEAAQQMQRAADQTEDSNQRQRTFLEDWLRRFEECLQSNR